MKTSIVFAPHPDDEVIGCGGSLFLSTRDGGTAAVVTLGARLSCPVEADLSEEDYRAEAADAHRALGVTRHVALEIPARTMVVTRELTLALVRELRIVKPHIVYMPHSGEVDLEHRTTCQAVMEALWIAQSYYFPEDGKPMPAPELVLAYEVWTPLPRYQMVVDISEAIERKREAMKAYRSQARHADWSSAIEGLARYRGVTTGAGKYAEVFEVISVVRGL